MAGSPLPVQQDGPAKWIKNHICLLCTPPCDPGPATHRQVQMIPLLESMLRLNSVSVQRTRIVKISKQEVGSRDFLV